MTLDADVQAMVVKLMRSRGLSFKQAVNQAIRAGLSPSRPSPRFRTPTFPMGFDPSVPLDRALRLAAELEDEELVRKLTARK